MIYQCILFIQGNCKAVGLLGQFVLADFVLLDEDWCGFLHLGKYYNIFHLYLERVWMLLFVFKSTYLRRVLDIAFLRVVCSNRLAGWISSTVILHLLLSLWMGNLSSYNISCIIEDISSISLIYNSMNDILKAMLLSSLCLAHAWGLL